MLKRYQSREFVCDILVLKGSAFPRHAITKNLREVTKAHWTSSAMNLWNPGCPASAFVSIWKNLRRPGRRLRLLGAARAQSWNWKWSAKEDCWSSEHFICANDLWMFSFSFNFYFFKQEDRVLRQKKIEVYLNRPSWMSFSFVVHRVIYIFYHLVSSTLQWVCAPCLPRP